MSDETRRFFDQRADKYYRRNYEAPQNRHGYTLWLRRDACMKLMPRSPGRILDLGCGPGAMTVPLLDAGHEVVACDISFEMTRDAAQRMQTLAGSARVAVADAMALPFANESFDTIVSTGVLEYVPDLAAAMGEIRRTLRPGGLFIGTMSLPRRFERYVVRSYSALQGRTSSATQYIIGRREFDRVVEAAGLSINARHCSSFAPFPLDALWPRSVMLVDKFLGAALNRSETACDQAKTYIVRAIR